jgi:hypothetical protein
MISKEIRAAFLAELSKIAPDIVLDTISDGDHGWRTLKAHLGNRRHQAKASKTAADQASFLSKFADRRICM